MCAPALLDVVTHSPEASVVFPTKSDTASQPARASPGSVRVLWMKRLVTVEFGRSCPGSPPMRGGGARAIVVEPRDDARHARYGSDRRQGISMPSEMAR